MGGTAWRSWVTLSSTAFLRMVRGRRLLLLQQWRRTLLVTNQHRSAMPKPVMISSGMPVVRRPHLLTTLTLEQHRSNPPDMGNAFADASMGGGMDMGMGGEMGGMGDMSNAFVTTANLCDSGPLAEWRAQNRADMEERASASKAQLDEIVAQAQSDRDAFYAQRQPTLDATKKANREAEASLKDSRASDAVKDNLWESVTELVDLQAKQDGSDISRMRQTMLAMKNETA